MKRRAWIPLLLLAAPSLNALAGTPRGDESLAQAVARALPTAVALEVDRGVVLSAGLEELWMARGLPRSGGLDPEAANAGSGVVIRSDGLVLTNYHVVAGANAIRVSFVDRRTWPARMVVGDPRTDLALVQITADQRFPAATMGDSDALPIGARVFTVGNPFDFAFTVTAGVLSARGRRDLTTGEFQDYLQTDAAINPGASGGPLFDAQGRLVGVNTAIYAATHGDQPRAAGLSFAIPIAMAQRTTDALLAEGRVGRAWLGVEVMDMPVGEAQPRPGAIIASVVPGSPADQAGLRREDMVYAVDGEPITGALDLEALVRSRPVGRPLRLSLLRDAVEQVIVVTPGDAARPPAVTKGGTRWAGLALIPLDAALRTRLAPDAPLDRPGLLVADVAEGSPGARAGLRPGDVVLEVMGQTAADVATLEQQSQSHKAVLISAWRRDGTITALIAAR